MRTRSEKIQLLTRLNRGQKALPSFLAELSKAVGEHITADALVTLPETDSLLETLRSGYQGSNSADQVIYQRYFRLSQRTKFFELGDCIGKRLSGEPVYLLTKLSDICGAVRMNLQTVLGHAASLIRLDGDSVCVVSEDRKQGLMMDHNIDDPEQTYELAVWGRRWSEAVSVCEDDV